MKRAISIMLLTALSAVATLGASISGQVTSGDYPAPTSRIHITLWQNDELVGISRVNPFGYFRFTGLASGIYTVTAMSGLNITFEPQDYELKLAGDMEAEVNFTYLHYNQCVIMSPC